MGVLESFSGDELLYDKEETVIILKFIFQPAHHAVIDELRITDHVRSFAQALLIEAVEGSYAKGFVAAIFDAISPTPKPASITKILKKLGQNAARHWFKYVSTSDLRKLKIYDSIRNSIGARNVSQLTILNISNRAEVHIINYDKNFPFPGVEKIWY
jgi:hypothetical protein